MGVFLRGLRRRPGAPIDGRFPWTIPALASLEQLAFTGPVTFFMGENGCGKSTLLEAIAVAAGAVAAGADDLAEDRTLAGAARLADSFALSQQGRPSAKMFFRAEDALGFSRRIERDVAGLDREIDTIMRDETASPAARRRPAGYLRGERGAHTRRYGEDPQAQSHGEMFLRILGERLAAGGLYLLDEPETPLSPTRVLALMAMLHASVRGGSQFVIATHSPILAALPGARILLFDNDEVKPVEYEQLEHVTITRDFLNAPARYLRHLLSEEG